MDATRRTYERLAELAAAAVRAGFPVIVDATFLKRVWRDRFRRLAEQLRIPFCILDFQASEDTLKERIVRREQTGRDASDANLAVLSRQIEFQEPLESDELSTVEAINSNALN